MKITLIRAVKIDISFSRKIRVGKWLGSAVERYFVTKKKKFQAATPNKWKDELPSGPYGNLPTNNTMENIQNTTSRKVELVVLKCAL